MPHPVIYHTPEWRKRKRKRPEAAFFSGSGSGSGKDKINGSGSGSGSGKKKINGSGSGSGSGQNLPLPPLPLTLNFFLLTSTEDWDFPFFGGLFVKVSPFFHWLISNYLILLERLKFLEPQFCLDPGYLQQRAPPDWVIPDQHLSLYLSFSLSFSLSRSLLLSTHYWKNHKKIGMYIVQLSLQ